MRNRSGARSASAAEAAEAKRIVVRLPNWLGDVVMATPGLAALRAAAPRSEIVALAPPALAPLVEGADLVDAVWPLASRTGGFGGWRDDVLRLRRERFDLGLVLPESISSAWLLRAGGVRRIVGFSRDPLRRALLHRTVPAPPEWGRRRLVAREHFVLTLMEAVGAASHGDGLRLATTDAEARRLARALAPVGSSLAALETHAPIVLAPGASYGPAKCWPAERYAALADRLALAGHTIVVVGAPGESARVEAVRQAMREPAIVLDGVLDVGALKALLSRAGGLVANDAGARHVAVGFDVPSVVFFGPTAVEKTAANLAGVSVLERDVDCRPCYRRTCPIDHRCLAGIEVETAWQALADRGVVVAGASPRKAARDRTTARGQHEHDVDLSVVIPSFEAPDQLSACLASIERACAAAPGLGVEVIVVDNGSMDDSPRRAIEAGMPPRLIAFARNRGFAAAANYGMRLARGRHLLVLNSDARVTSELLEGAVAALDADPRIAVLGPALRYADGRPQRSVHRWPSLATELFGERAVDFVAERGRRASAGGEPDRENVVDVPAVRGAVFFIGAAAREKLGGFDEGYFFFLEETDYCLRACAAGDRVVFAPGLVAEHALGASSKSRAPAAVRIEYHRSLERFLRRHRASFAARMAMGFRALRQTLVLPLLFVGAGLGFVSRERLLERARLVLWHLRGRPGSPSLEAALRSAGGQGGSA